MCFLIQSKANAFELSSHYNAMLKDANAMSTNAHVFGVHNPKYHIITEEDPHVLKPITWGMDCSAIDKKSPNELEISIEEVFSSLPDLFQRCVIPVTGFYEFVMNEKKEICQNFIHLDGEIFTLAGVYGEFFDTVNEKNLEFFMLLTAPTYAPLPYLCDLHRIPIAIKDTQTWLNQGKFEVIQDFSVEFMNKKQTEDLIRAVQTPGADLDPHKIAS